MFGSSASSKYSQHREVDSFFAVPVFAVSITDTLSSPHLGLVQIGDELGSASHQLFLFERMAADRFTAQALRNLLLLSTERIWPRLGSRADLPSAANLLAFLVLGVTRQQISLPRAGPGPAHELAFDELHRVERVAAGALGIALEVPVRVGIEVVLG